MASAQDIFNALKSANIKLDQLSTETAAGVSATKQVRDAVHNVDSTLKQGFLTASQDAQALGKILTKIGEALVHLQQQEDTLICLLDKVARQSCATLNHVAVQTEFMQSVADAVSALSEMYRSSNPASALEFERQRGLRAKVEQCCPPPEREPECEYRPCESPSKATGEFPVFEVPGFPRRVPGEEGESDGGMLYSRGSNHEPHSSVDDR